MTFYDLNGKPIAYLYGDGKHIYLFNGKPVAYLQNNTIYGFNGHHIGWFDKGWIRDLNGNCAFFTEDARGSGPVKPVKHVTPVKGVTRVQPVKGVQHVQRVRSVDTLSWSSLSGEQFFNQ